MNWILDLDGVVWRGTEEIPGSSEAIASLASMKQGIFFVTNNSLLTVGQYVQKLESFSIEARAEQVVTSAMAAASLVERSSRVYLVGGGGLREALQARDIEIVEADGPVESVVVGWDPEISFEKISLAMKAIRSGARYIATNSDPTYPSPDGLLPGTGSIAAAVQVASGVLPIFAGKPNKPIADLIMPFISKDDVMIGDRLSTDGMFSKALGIRFGLVKTGVNEVGVDFDFGESVTVAEDLLAMVELFRHNGSLPSGDYSH